MPKKVWFETFLAFLEGDFGLPALRPIWEDTKNVALEDPDLYVDAEASGSRDGLEHCETSVGLADHGVDFLFSHHLLYSK